MDLFDQQTSSSHQPLAARMRPQNLDEYIGQNHIVGKGRLLRRAIAADQLASVIFYGPPGTGKTTLARVIANHTKSNFLTLNAVLTGVQNIRDSVKTAEEQYRLYGRRTILFVDEVHRWNKSQQDALLPWVENGTIILIGATTENPFFEVNKALVSRSRVFQLKPLTDEDLMNVAKQAITNRQRGYGKWKITFEDGALEHLVSTANGDARSLLNALELAVETTPEQWLPDATPCIPAENSEIYISKETAEESIQKKVVLYDRDGDYHYDVISAFIKSLRGRDPDAALYWMARMITAGEDPHFIFRRMLISACEDTGLADPNALTVVESCAAAFDRIGLPEGNYMLTQAALYLATAPKSNSSMAFFDALKTVRQEDAEVPNHLRDASRDGEGFGHGAGYLYPHAYRDHWVPQQYLPDGLEGRVFYNPGNQGYEKTIRDEVLSRRELQITALLEDTQIGEDQILNPMGSWWAAEHLKHGNVKTGENLTYTPQDKKLEQWQKRTDEGRSESLLQIRNKLLDSAKIARHNRNLVLNADDGLFVWETLRRSPEGYTAGLCKTFRGKQVLEQYASTLNELDRPVFATTLGELGDVSFDSVFCRNPFTSLQSIENFARNTAESLQTGTISTSLNAKAEPNGEASANSAGLAKLPGIEKTCIFALAQNILCKNMRLGEALQTHFERSGMLNTQDRQILQKYLQAENEFYSQSRHPLFCWNEEKIQNIFESCGLQFFGETEEIETKRIISPEEAKKWFDVNSSEYANFVAQKLSRQELDFVHSLLMQVCKRHIALNWKSPTLFAIVRQ
ncbi:MAG: AAA family ATPase [Treponemataceae bacterium]|nr:AAA family ATPase [Treponemataceae bacterium]